MVINTSRAGDGQSVLSLLKENGFSRKSIARLKRLENGIMLGGVRVTVRATVREGDLLEVADCDTELDENEFLIPSDIPLDIIYEDEYLVIPNKPSGMPTHPSLGHHNDSLANALAFYYRDRPFVFRPVNRLDRDTSGIVLCAKDKRTASILAGQIENRTIGKKYVALLDGVIDPPEGRIESHIRRREASIITRESVSDPTPDSKPALTFYKVLSAGGGLCKVLCEPYTGRTHQLRVHFADKSCPILGDTLYGRESGLIGRQALHACSISFRHPASGERVEFSAPLPGDMKAVTDKFLL